MTDFILHDNNWWWGKSIDIVHPEGLGIVCVKFDDECPITAYISDLSVVESHRHLGIGGELLNYAINLAKKHNKSYARLNVDKDSLSLVAWYKSKGFEIIQIDEHEYQMVKILS